MKISNDFGLTLIEELTVISPDRGFTIKYMELSLEVFWIFLKNICELGFIKHTPQH